MSTFKTLISRIIQLNDELEAHEKLGSRNQPPPPLEALIHSVDSFYILYKLQLNARLLVARTTFHPSQFNLDPSDDLLIHEISALVRDGHIKDPRCKIYEKIIRLYERIDDPDPWDDYLLTEIEILLDSQEVAATIEGENVPPLFTHYERTEIYSFLTNYFTKRSNKKGAYYTRFAFKYQNRLTTLMMTDPNEENPLLLPAIMKNIISISINIDQPDYFQTVSTHGIQPLDPEKGYQSNLEWAEQFVNYYQHHLSADSPELYVAYCKGLIAFKNKNFLPAFEYIKNSKYIRDTFIDLSTAALNLVTLYEIDQADPAKLRKEGIILENVLEAYRKNIENQISNKKVTNTAITEFHQSLYRLFRDIIRLSSAATVYKGREQPGFKKSWHQLREEAQTRESMFMTWIIEKLDLIKPTSSKK